MANAIDSVGCLSKPNAITRFESKYAIEPNSGCWLWEKSLFHDGYAQFFDGRTMVRAHRFSYEQFVGKIADGLIVCHRCDTPSCVNPAHLFVGTQRENIADCRRKNRIYKKLNNEKIAEIRALIRQGVTQKAIATRFGVNASLVAYIKTAPHYGP